MRSNGLATVLLMIPVLTVPALAIFGIPQFAPVVASPLNESDSVDEDGVGNSARQSHDELFDEIDGADSERSKKGASSSRLREPSSLSQRRPLRSNEPQDAAGWGDDLDQPAEPQRSARSGLPRKSTEEVQTDRSARGRLPNSGARSELPSRYERNPKQLRSTESASTTSDNTGAYVSQAAYFEEPADRDGRTLHTNDETPAQTVPRSKKMREPPVEELTWSAAVERLNELEIRNFRLEPGPRLGLFVFICSYTAPDTPSVSYRFEAEADQPLKAVQKVLEQIVDWRQRR